MISQTAVVLAVALPLLLCVLVLIATCAILLLRFRRRRAEDRINLQELDDERAKLEKQLAAFPKAWQGQQQDSGFSRPEVKESFDHLCLVLESFVEKWIVHGAASAPPREESATRIELLLFPEPPPEHFLTTGKDTRIFPNPHQYTPAEICALLEQNYTRDSICHHILASILLKGISFEGNPHQSLLPFDPTEVYALDKLRNLIRGTELFHVVPVHISKFGVYYAQPPKPGHPQEVSQRAQYIKLFESLFDPHFKTVSPADATQRRLQFDIVMDATIQLGMRVVGTPHEMIEYRWGSRNDNEIMFYPALYALGYKGEELAYASELCKSSSIGLGNG